MSYPKPIKRLVRRLDRHVHADGWRLRDIKPGTTGTITSPAAMELTRSRPVRFEGPGSVVAFLDELRQIEPDIANLSLQLGSDYINFDSTNGWTPDVETWVTRGRSARNQAKMTVRVGQVTLIMVGSGVRRKRPETRLHFPPGSLDAARKLCPLIDENLRQISIADRITGVCLVEPVSVPEELKSRRDLYVTWRSAVIGAIVGLGGSLIFDWLRSL